MSRPILRTQLLFVLAVPTLVTGAWALVAPASWHADFPGLGRDWLPAFGAYNEHLARDFGGALLALGALLAWAALAPRGSLRRAVPAAFLLFALPHFAFHAFNLGELPAGDDVVNLVTLGLSVAIPLLVLFIDDEPRLRMRAQAGGAGARRLPPAPARNPVARLAYAYSRRRFGHVLGPIGAHAHNPKLLAAYSVYELGLERADRVDRRLEELAATRASNMTGCPFCIDFAAALLGQLGFTREQVGQVDSWRESEVFSDDERLVLEYGEAISTTPVHVSDELFERLRARFDEAAIVELTAAIAFENYRGRFNHAVGLGSEGFCGRQANGRPVPAKSAA
jgi:AhpD family alkylhydroperoxidase